MRIRYRLSAPQQENEFYRPYHHGAHMGTPVPARYLRLGSYPRIISGLQTLGLEAIALTLGGSWVVHSLLWALWKYVTAKQAKSSAHAETGKGGKALKAV